MPQTREWSTLLADLELSAEPDAPIAEKTWFRIGGRADLLVTPRTPQALATLVARAHADDIPLRVLGGGANLLVLDEGVDGIVVSLRSPCFTDFEIERGGDSALVRVGGGHDLFELMHKLNRAGLGGLEHLAGIPGTVGGAVVMNAGGQFGDIAQALSHVTVVTPKGTLQTFARSELQPGYRHGGIPAGIVTSAVFCTTPADPKAVRDRFLEHFSWKKSRQPFDAAAAGCMFKNPVDPKTGERVSAGMLIDRAGLKGFRVGGAVVSSVHANFLAADGAGTASDIAMLAERVADRVWEHCGIRLEREVVFWGRSRP